MSSPRTMNVSEAYVEIENQLKEMRQKAGNPPDPKPITKIVVKPDPPKPIESELHRLSLFTRARILTTSLILAGFIYYVYFRPNNLE